MRNTSALSFAAGLLVAGGLVSTAQAQTAAAAPAPAAAASGPRELPKNFSFFVVSVQPSHLASHR